MSIVIFDIGRFTRIYHYCDVIMITIASQITSLTIVYLTVNSGTDQRSSTSLAFVRGIHRRPVNSPHKGPVTRKMFPFDDVIMRHRYFTGTGTILQQPKQDEAKQNCVDISWNIQFIPRKMHTVFALLCFVVVIHWLIFPYPSGLLHWHCGNLTIAPVPAKQPWWIWKNTSREFIMNDCITTTKQSTTKPCGYFMEYTVVCICWHHKPSCWLHSFLLQDAFILLD